MKYPKNILMIGNIRPLAIFRGEDRKYYNDSRVFYACCTISMHITVILVVMLKSAILLPKNSMCPILPLNKNYLRNYLEPKNYLEIPEWQDDSWSGNCLNNTLLGGYLPSRIHVYSQARDHLGRVLPSVICTGFELVVSPSSTGMCRYIPVIR